MKHDKVDFYHRSFRNDKKDPTFKIKKSFTMKFVIDRASHNMSGKAANHVKMKLKGSGSCKF